ncbi:MAG TPA: hypothetical protein VFE24_15125, partial [Pirellulales bacterium]|nr:hypothetical protein [Pirellulales bacterium]
MNAAVLHRLEAKLQESYQDLWSQAVDLEEPLYDVDGTRWLPVGEDSGGSSTASLGWNEPQLREIRRQCRALAAHNEYAINGHENRISYIVGAGHTYRAALKKGTAAPADLALQVQGVLDDFLRLNQWQRRQQEIVRRRDRDGEAFLRFFAAPDGTLRI